MKSIDKLREWADRLRGVWIDPNDHTITITTGWDAPPDMDSVSLRDHVNGILDGIERDVEERYTPLPVDADGVPIHVGERVQLIGNDPSTVSHMSLAGDGWRVYVKYDGDLGTGSGEPSRIRHHHAPTVEDVMVEFATDWESAQDGEDKTAVLMEYAAKLQLKEG